VKIAPYAKVAREKSNYDRLVRPHLPARLRPDLLGFARARDLGALCYAWVSSPRAPARTLTAHLQGGDAAALTLVLGEIFDPRRPAWGDTGPIRFEGSIARRYRRRFFKQRSILAGEAILAQDIQKYFAGVKRGTTYAIGDAIFPLTAATLFGEARRLPYRSGLIHGDLNSDNVLVAPDSGLVNLIDFEHVEDGHAYEDIASIEASVRINYPADRPFAEIFERERLIAENLPMMSNDAYTAAILSVRRAAAAFLPPIDDWCEYHFAVAAQGLRLMHAVDLHDVARARVAASTLWATRALSSSPRFGRRP
jgi:hypothetical protein